MTKTWRVTLTAARLHVRSATQLRAAARALARPQRMGASKDGTKPGCGTVEQRRIPREEFIMRLHIGTRVAPVASAWPAVRVVFHGNDVEQSGDFGLRDRIRSRTYGRQIPD